MTRRTKSAALSAIVGLALALTSCTTVQEYRKGEIAPGRYLSTLRLVDRAEVQRLCPRVVDPVGCMEKTWVRIDGRMVALIRVSVTELDAELLAHEACHAIAEVHIGLGALDRDPCHDEDGGIAMTRSRWKR